MQNRTIDTDILGLEKKNASMVGKLEEGEEMNEPKK